MKTNQVIQSIILSIIAMALCALLYLLLSGHSETYDAHKYNHLSKHSILVAPPLPDSLSFANEKVPLKLFDIKESLDQELSINCETFPATTLIIKRMNRWKEPILKILKEQGIPEDFFYLMVAESGMRNVASSMGAKGFWQFLEQTARECGLQVDANVDERNHPIKATYAACKYLRKAYNKFHNWTAVAASYNMGMYGLANSMKFQKSWNYYQLHLNNETARYVFRILSFKLILNDPEKYGFKMFPGDLYEPYQTRKVYVTESVPNLVSFAKSRGTNYKMLRYLNPWILKSTLPAVPGKMYEIQLPLEYDANSINENRVDSTGFEQDKNINGQWDE